MNTGSDSADTKSRWRILTQAGLTATLVVAAPTMAMPVLFAEISEELHMSLVQVGTVWGLVSFAGLFSGLFGGMLGDRLGTNRTLAIACLFLGLFGAARGLSGSLAVLSITVFLSGFVSSTIPVNLHKVCAYWFSGKRLGLANSVISAGMALGFMAGSLLSSTVLSPWLSGWRGVLFLYGGVGVVFCLPWFFGPVAAEERKHLHDESAPPSLARSFARVIRLKEVWVLGICLLGVGGGVQGFLGYLPLYLRNAGWSAASADGALSSFHAVSLLAVIPLAWLSDRLSSRRHFLIAAAMCIACGIGLLSVAEGFIIWICVLIAGTVRDGYMAVFMTTATEAKGVGALYAGTALGLTMTISRVGGILAPPLGNSLATINPRLPFALWGVMALLGLLVLSLNSSHNKGRSTVN